MAHCGCRSTALVSDGIEMFRCRIGDREEHSNPGPAVEYNLAERGEAIRLHC
jgi:hypothetical protein